MRITTLVENHVADTKSNLVAEHGLSLHIEHEGRKILFDTGASDAFVLNASKLGIDLGQVDVAVLSHHHFDHGGGLSAFFAVNNHAKVYLRHPPEGVPHFKALGIINREIGLREELLSMYHDRFVFVDQFSEAWPGAFLLTEIVHQHERPAGNRFIYLKKNNSYVHDPFNHELVLAIRAEGGLVTITGCSHNGALNMIETVREKFPDEHIRAVVGGFHLIGLPIVDSLGGSKADIVDIGRTMRQLPVDQFWTGHCTGKKAFKLLQGELGDRLAVINTGSRITL